MAATHEESKAEDRHDTFAIENSYLAAGQSARAAELEATLHEFEGYLQQKAPHIRVGRGSLVEFELNGIRQWGITSNLGGGTKIQANGQPLQVISLQSPLGEALEGCQAGEITSFEVRNQERDLEVLQVS